MKHDTVSVHDASTSEDDDDDDDDDDVAVRAAPSSSCASTKHTASSDVIESWCDLSRVGTHTCSVITHRAAHHHTVLRVLYGVV